MDGSQNLANMTTQLVSAVLQNAFPEGKYYTSRSRKALYFSGVQLTGGKYTERN